MMTVAPGVRAGAFLIVFWFNVAHFHRKRALSKGGFHLKGFEYYIIIDFLIKYKRRFLRCQLWSEWWLEQVRGKKNPEVFMRREWQFFRHVVKEVTIMADIERKGCYWNSGAKRRGTRSGLKVCHRPDRKSFSRSAGKSSQWRERLKGNFPRRAKKKSVTRRRAGWQRRPRRRHWKYRQPRYWGLGCK